jgi:hypothetical protein
MMPNSRRRHKSAYRLVRFCTIFFTALVSLIFWFMAGPSPGWAGLWGRCDQPAIFERSAVNVIILPYTLTGRMSPEIGKPQFSRTGEKLSVLIQLDSLFSMVKYNSIAVAYLSQGSKPLEMCQPELILDKILGRKEEYKKKYPQISPRKGVAILWGRIYEEGNNIYVQSYLQFLRRDAFERFKISLPTQEGSSVGFFGELPSQSFAFAPRRITLRDLQNIEKEFQSSVILREKPDESAQGTQINLKFDPGSPAADDFAYYVTEISGDWMYIVSMPKEYGGYGPKGPEGWVRAHMDPMVMPLRQKLPELDFLDAAVGYLQYQIARDTDSRKQYRKSIFGWVKKALERYQENSGSEQAALPTAVGKILRGTLEILEDDLRPRATTIDIAQNLYTQAASLIPYNADARNLELITRINLWHAAKPPRPDPKAIISDLLNVIELEPQNEDVLANLENFLLLLSSYKAGEVTLDPAELTRQINAVHDVRSALKTLPKR